MLGATETSYELCNSIVGPHQELWRAGDTIEPRPGGPGVPTRGQDDAQQAQAGNQVQTEESMLHLCVCSSSW